MENQSTGIPKTFIALPAYSVDALHVQCLMTLAVSRLNVGLQFNVGDSSPTRARNTLTAQFLASDCEQILFIDSDILFHVEHISRICSHRELVVGGFYCKKQQGTGALVFNSLDANQIQPPRPDGLQKVKYMGTGFLCIKRTVFEIMINRFGEEMVFHPDETAPDAKQYAFWQEGPYQYKDGNRRFLTEDWRFCQKCHDCGIDVWGDTGILVDHRGMTQFPLETQKADICGVKPAPAAAPSLPLPVDSNAAAVVLPPGFKVPAEAVQDAKEIMSGCYDVPQLKEPPKRILDAGAHVGMFSWWAAKRWPGAVINSYEPTNENFDALLANMAATSMLPSKVLSEHSALSNHNNEIVLRKGINSLCHSARPEFANGEQFKCPCTDASKIGKFDFVKVDTEGSEIDILTALDLSETKAVVCESHCENDRIHIRKLMEIKGFTTLLDQPTLRTARLLKFARPEAITA